MEGVFRFPRAVFVDQNNIIQQFRHVRSEIDEVWQELEPGYSTGIFDPVRVAEESMDAIHSLESLLRILAEKYKVDLMQGQEQLINKNRARGYYAD